jgi:hypothetical protein
MPLPTIRFKFTAISGSLLCVPKGIFKIALDSELLIAYISSAIYCNTQYNIRLAGGQNA